MKALTVTPFSANSAGITEIDEPSEQDGPILVETIAVGICGTDLEIVSGDYGQAPTGEKLLVLGHESIGRVLEAPSDSGFKKDDLVVGIVRRPDPVPCAACAHGEWDACENGLYTEHGIKSLNGFMRERYRVLPDALVLVDQSLGELGVLLEPTTIVAKAFEQVLAIGHRQTWDPTKLLVIGAGPIGLLAALIGVQSGLHVDVLDHVDTGAKPDLVHSLGANYHTGAIKDAASDVDIVLECTGVPSLIADSVASLGPSGVVCLTGISPIGSTTSLDLGQLARDVVLGNQTIVGSVNANRRHYEKAAEILAKADRKWLGQLISRKVPLVDFADAFERQPDDVKVILSIAS